MNFFFLLSVTAFPGLHKIIVFLFIRQYFPDTEVGAFVNDIFIIYILGYFTSFNWANFIMADMRKLPQAKRPAFWNKIFLASLPVMLLLSLVLAGLSGGSLIVDLPGSCIYLAAWSFHQLWRHYFLAQSSYRILFVSDILMLAGSLAAVLGSARGYFGLLAGQGIICLLAPLLSRLAGGDQPSMNVYLPQKFSRRVYQKAFNFALVNLCTGGIQLFFAPLSYQMLNAHYAALIGLCSNISSTVLLFPRAIAYFFIPKMSEAYRSSRALLFETQGKFERFIWVITLISLGFGLLAYVPYSEFNDTQTVLPYSFFIFMLLYSTMIISQISVPLSNLLVIVNKYNKLLFVNVQSLVIYSLVFLLIQLTVKNGIAIFMLSLGIHLATHFYRYFLLNHISKRI